MIRKIRISSLNALYKRYGPISLLWLGSTLFVFAAVILDQQFLVKGQCFGDYFGYNEWFSCWDGQWYNRIAEKGYSGEAHFFPLYPLLGAIVHKISKMNIEYSLLTVSLTASYSFSLVWRNYLERKSGNNALVITLGSALVLLWPASYFMRANYTESLYLLLAALFLLGMLEQKSVLWLVIICGLLTATRPNGIVCPLVLGIHCLFRTNARPYRHNLSLAVWATLASFWGLGAYMLYLAATYGDPLLWLKDANTWLGRDIIQNPIAYWSQIISLRPAWGFLFNGDIYRVHTYPFNLQNRVFMLTACAALIIGACKKWITREEFCFCLFTLMVVYYSSAQLWGGMPAIGRYCLALLPAFYVYARLLARTPLEIQLLVIGFCAAGLMLHTGLFLI